MQKSLKLYYTRLSFYSQKAKFFIVEKGLPHQEYLVDLHGGECYTPWYMKINPAGKVPVLQHGDRYIPDSLAILEYLDKTFPDSPRLVADPATIEGILMKKFCDLCRECRLEKLTYGVQLFQDLVEDSQIPEYLRQFMIKKMFDSSGMFQMFSQKAEQYPELRDIYLTKRDAADKTFQFAREPDAREQVVAEIEICQKIMDVAEEQLKDNVEAGRADSWLFSDYFSVADIEMALLYRRLTLLGLAKCTFKDGKHQHVEKYMKRLDERQSVQDILFNVGMTSDWFRFMVRRNRSKVLKTAAFGAITAGVGYILYKKFFTQ